MRDVNYGWLLRYIHANVASFFFIFVYAHIGRGLYYGSYKAPRTLTWSVGVIMLVLIMGIAFLGLYSLTYLSTNPFSAELDSVHTLMTSIVPCSPALKSILDKHNLKPLLIFEDLLALDIRQRVSLAVRNMAGVYAIVNLVNGKIYVGSGILNRMYYRFCCHLFYFTGSKIVAAAVAKYGLGNFAFLVLESVPGPITADNKEVLLQCEDRYIQLLSPSYNVAPQASNTFGVKHTDETKARMRDAFTPERRLQVGDINRGREYTYEERERIRQQALTRPPMSDETRSKVSANSAKAMLYEV